ncbi:MAG: hypothetical protein AAGA03_03110 [Planctomycetota bacterium]
MKYVLSLFTITLIVSLAGCGPGGPATGDASPQESSTGGHSDDDHGHAHDDHGHGDGGHPESFAEAVEQVKEVGGRITRAFASGDPNKAHGDLHEIGHLIGALPELAKKAGVPSEKMETVRTVTEALLDSFEALDGTLHGGVGVEVEDVSKEISTQLDSLQALL